MINKFKNSFNYTEKNRLYLIHDDIIFVFEGSELISTIEKDLKLDDLSENLAILNSNLSTNDVIQIMDGTLSITLTSNILDEYQLEAYAKYPSSTGICAVGGGPTGSDNPLSDDNNCITYAP
jgi:hypothetical protein